MKRAILIYALVAPAAIAQSTITGSKTMQGSWDASGASATKPAKSGTTLPSTCKTGEFFFNTAAAAGQNLYLCDPDNTWTQGSSGVGSVFGRTGNVSAQTGDYNFSQLSGTVNSSQLPAAGGDLSGTLGAATVQAIQGKPVSGIAPSSGQVLAWNGSAWAPQSGSGGSGGGSSTAQAVVFDGSTTSLADGSVLTWSACGTNARCATWNVPSGVNWVSVESWGGGGPGTGATGATSGGSGGAGGAGGGYGRRMCRVTPGGAVTVQVGLGGTSASGFGATLVAGGISLFGTCIGGTGGSVTSIYANGNPPGVQISSGVAAPWGPWWANNGFYSAPVALGPGVTSPGNTVGYLPSREDQGGWPGSGWASAGVGDGLAAGFSIGGGGGGGGGASQTANGGLGSTSVLGGAGGNGAGSGSACQAGSIPGGGGGGAFVGGAGSSTSGCNGARGEVRVYYVH